MKILIADGSAVIRASLLELFADMADLELVGMAADATRAMELVAALKPDVVILDVRLAGANGIGALQAIKKVRPMPAVIATTIYPYDEYCRACIEQGADFFLNKATEFEKIPLIVQALMQPCVAAASGESTAATSVAMRSAG